MKYLSQKFALVRNNFFQSFSIIFALLVFQNSYAQLSGTVFKDYDGSGTQTATKPYEPGVSGVTVRLFVGNSMTPVIATTIADGTYSFTAVQAPKDSMARIEFANLPDAYAPSLIGGQSMSELRFLKLPSIDVNLGIMTDDEYCVTGQGLTIATPCFVNGDPLAGGTAGQADAFVQFDYNASGQAGATNYPLKHLATAKQVGSIWASTYQKASEQLVLAAMVRRHVGLGPLGTGGMYKLDLKTNVVTNFLDVKTIGINTGPDPHSGLPANKEGQSHDSLTYIMACRVGMGGVQFSRYQDTMFVVNQYDKKLYNFLVNKPLTAPNIATAKLKSRPIPHPNCSNNDFAPWSLKQYKGKLYLGVVCTAETSQDTNDLRAAVYQFNPSSDSFTKVIDFSLNFKRDPIDATGPDCFKINRWFPWTNKFPLSCSGIGYGPNFIMYPQPLLSDIEFDDDGSMILGFVDRFGFQAGQAQYGIAQKDTTKYYGFMSGDTYRAQLTPTGFVLESNAKSGALSGCGPNKGAGPGGGEFFCDDSWFLKLGGVAGHQEITNGGIFKQPGMQEVLVSAMDPINEVVLSTGFRAFSTLNGKMSRSYSLYSNQPGTLGKSGGVGDLTGLCAPAPLEIGNRVWYDKNRNGIQDANEKGIDGLIITLHDMATGGAIVAKDTTANGGQYYFGDYNITGGILRRHNYQVRMSMKQAIPAGLLSGKGVLKDSLNVTVLNATGFTNPQIRDSNAKSIGDSLVVPVLTQESGENDYTFDIGLNSRVAILKGSLGDYVWKDVNNDGKQDATDIPQKGVIIELYKNNILAGKDTTDAMGKYLFVNLDSATYCIKVVASSLAPGCVISPKQAFAGVPDSLNSDVNPVTFKSQNVIIDPTPIAGVSKKDNLFLDVALYYDCVKPVFTLTPQFATCNGSAANSDAKILVSNVSNGASYVFGTDSTAFKYINAVAFSNNSFNISNLTNPTVAKTYFVRIYNGVADCYATKSVVIQPTNCTLPCVKPSFTLTPSSATCSGNTALNDAKILVTGASNGLTYSFGADSTAFTFTSATAYSGNGFNIINIANPTTAKTYFIRIYNGKLDCYTTKMVIIQPTTCNTSCVKPSFILTPSSASCNGTMANNDAKILITGASNGLTWIYGADSTAFTFAASTAYSGNSITVNSISNPTIAKMYFVRIYNGTANCYTTKMVTIQPTDCSEPCIKPSFKLISSSATCNGMTANNDAQIIVSGASNGLTYTYGTDSTTFNFGASTAYIGNSFSIKNIPNSLISKTYFVRIYNGAAGCYVTKAIVIKATDCSITFDLELTKTVVGDCKRKIGDIIQYKVVVRNVPISNGSIADSVYVSDTLAANLTFKSAKATRGTYDNIKHIWGMLQIPQGGSDTLTITAQINANGGFEGGSICNVAQIQKARGKDINSTPGNNVKTENDYGIACVSVPMKLCSARKDTLIITAPAGYDNYQWFKNDVKIIGATKSTLEVGAAGDYRVEVSGGNCITKNCCPAYVIDFCECPAEICVPFVIKKTKAKGIPINSIVR